jgi:CTP:molybdopterin cytidylyltransferase MocA
MVTFDPKEQLTVELASVSKVNAAVEVAIVEPSVGPLRNIIHGGVVVLVVEEPVVELVDVDVPEELVEVAVPLASEDW